MKKQILNKLHPRRGRGVPRGLTLETLEPRNLLSSDLWSAGGLRVDVGDRCDVLTTTVAVRPAPLARLDTGAGNSGIEDQFGPQQGFGTSVLSPPLTNSHAQWAAAVDDAFENNDYWYQAADLGTVSGVSQFDNLVMNDRADWYRFQLDQPADESSAVSIDFQHALGDIDMVVYDHFGRRVGYSNSTTDNERVSLSGRGAGTYYVVVYGYAGATNPDYSLQIVSGAVLQDDPFEQNDLWAQASDLGTLESTTTIAGLVMADSHDWYRFTMTGSGSSTNYVGITFQHAQGDLDLSMYDAQGQLVGYSNGVGDREQVSLDGLSAGTYYVHVYGYAGARNPEYTLLVSPGLPALPVPPVTTPSTPPATQPPATQPPVSQPPATSPASAFQIDVSMSGLTSTQQAIVRDAAARWEQIVVGDLPNEIYAGRIVDDLAIDVSARPIDGPGGILGGAAPDRFRPGTLLPYHGTIQFDSVDLARLEANGTLRDVILHEMGHVLGIGTIWQGLGLLAGANTNDPQFLGAQATAEYAALTGHAETSVPVANTGGAGTRGGHWRESVFTNELMTGYVGPGQDMPLSRVTVASLADLGYQVNLAAADPYQLA